MNNTASDLNLNAFHHRPATPRCRQARTRRAGNTIVQAAIIIPIILGILSLAVDLANIMCVRAELQSAVDSAALAGSGGLLTSPAEVRLRAKTIAASNRVNGKPLVLTDSDIELGTWNASTRSFTVLTGVNELTADAVRINGVLNVSRNNAVKLTFLPLISSSFTSFGAAKSAVSVARKPAADVVLVQDVSGSFENEIAFARAGDRDLLDSLSTTGTKSNFGVVAFTGNAATICNIKAVSGNYPTLKSAVDSLYVNGWGMPSTASGTDIAAGIEQGKYLFDHFSSTNSTRCMVIVSDGEPSSNSQGAHPWYSEYQLLMQAQYDANAVYAAGIDVYVVFWDSANDPTAAANLRSLVRGKGVFVHVTDPTKISEAIATVLTRSQALVK